MTYLRPIMFVVAACGIGVVAANFTMLSAQAPTAPKPPADRFEFEIVECYDAKYAGDTPGHIGRHGELGDTRPHAALGDPVFRGAEQVGTVTGLTWSPSAGSLEVEFDPRPDAHISVGETVWIRIGSTAQQAK